MIPEKMNRVISRWLFWVGVIVFAIALNHQLLGTPKSWLMDFGCGLIVASVSYWAACFTEGMTSFPVQEITVKGTKQ